VTGLSWNVARALPFGNVTIIGSVKMGRGCLLWLLGVPIPVIIVLLLIFHH
jgi:hypothetical protein